MEQAMAWKVAVGAIKAASQLNNLVPELKSQCSQEQFDLYRDAIAAISFSITTDILNPIFKEHPSIDLEIDKLMAQGSDISSYPGKL